MSAPAVGVCGFGRCGSTMLMAMLDAGGIGPCAGSARGSYELSGLDEDTLKLGDLDGKAVKLLDSVLHGFVHVRSGGWRLIWLDRVHTEQSRSQVKFVEGICGMSLRSDSAERLAESYRRDMPKATRLLNKLGPTLLLTYEGVLAAPLYAARLIADFLTPDFALDVDAAARVVHDRDGTCRPDLSVELRLISA